MNTIVKSVSDYVTEISSANKQLIKNGLDKNEVLLFRGHADECYELIPSIGRNRISNYAVSFFNEERNLIDICKYKMPDIFRNDLSPVELLALLQHHGIPTRLLDVTENALVALFFACCEAKDKNGEVFAFRTNEKTVTIYPLIEAIADSYRLIKGTDYPIDSFYKMVKEESYFLEQRNIFNAIEEMQAEELYKTFGVTNIQEYLVKLLEKPLFTYAPIRSVRQQVQQGRYILFPNSISDFTVGSKIIKVFASEIAPIAKDDDCIIKKIIIRAEDKKNLLSELRLFGISEDTLFCDNTDIVCKCIKESFREKINPHS